MRVGRFERAMSKSFGRVATVHEVVAAGKRAFYQDVVNALQPAKEWLIVGPGTARDELARHIRDHHPHLTDRIVGVEPADHPTEAQIVAHAQTFFRAADRMLP